MKEIVKNEEILVEGYPKAQEENTDLKANKLPLGVSLVSAGLYVCGAHACPGAVRVLRPACIVNAAPELSANPAASDVPHYATVPILDLPDADIFSHLDQVADLIHQVVSGGDCVLVHCVAGVSRSVSLCLAYLMKHQRLTLRDAYQQLKQTRPQIRPNTGFFKQLIKYEQILFNETSVKMVYCDVIDKDIPDVYEADYQGMAWYKKRYGAVIR